jgi:hypothetical protein
MGGSSVLRTSCCCVKLDHVAYVQLSFHGGNCSIKWGAYLNGQVHVMVHNESSILFHQLSVNLQQLLAETLSGPHSRSSHV